MPVTNNETTGRTGVCDLCRQPIEEALLLKGFMVWQDKKHEKPKVPSPGVPMWRRLDRGPGSARCAASMDGRHVPIARTTREPVKL